jgi:hypothetical protein
MEPVTPIFVWTAEHAAWLAEALERLNWTYRDLDDALGYKKSRGSYTRQVCECGLVPGLPYRKRLARWWANNPQPRPAKDLLLKIQTVVVPWLRAREGQPVARSYNKQRAKVAVRRLGHHGQRD